MRIAFICQAVDSGDTVQASTVSWLRVLASKPQVEKLFVITLRRGTFVLPDNVEVNAVEGRKRYRRLADFYLKVLKTMRRDIDCFFIHQGGPYPALLLPFRLFAKKSLFQWKTHSYVGPMMGLYARFCDNIVFTATPQSFPLDLPNVRVVGHGVDTERFRKKPVAKDGKLITVGRISPIKGLRRMIRSLALLNSHYGLSLTLDVYGPTLAQDVEYLQSLKKLATDLAISHCVVFRGPVAQAQLPDILNRYELFLNYSDTALDRAVTEAMGCGLPVVSSNPCFAEILPNDLREHLVIPRDDVNLQAEAIHRVLAMRDEQRSGIGKCLRAIVLRDHNIETLFDKVLAEIEENLH